MKNIPPALRIGISVYIYIYNIYRIYIYIYIYIYINVSSHYRYVGTANVIQSFQYVCCAREKPLIVDSVFR